MDHWRGFLGNTSWDFTPDMIDGYPNNRAGRRLSGRRARGGWVTKAQCAAKSAKRKQADASRRRNRR